MILFISLILVLQLYFCIRGLLPAVCYMLLVRILVPDAARSIIVDTSVNTLCSLFVLVLFICNVVLNPIWKKTASNFINRFILTFFVLSILITLIPNEVPFSIQIGHLLQFFITQLLPIVFITTAIRNKTDLHKVIHVFTLAFFICIVYGLSCFMLQLPYPYNQWFIDVFGYGRDADMITEMGMEFGGITGRIVGTPTADSYSFGMIVPIAFTTQFCIYHYIKGRFNLVLLLMLAMGVICTTRRSPILTVVVFCLCLFLFDNIRYKRIYIKYMVLLFVVAVLLLLIFPELLTLKHIFETVFFFWDDSVAIRNSVMGSSVSLREYQFYYTLNQIRDNWLIGNGWNAMYYKYHPGMFGWESIIFTTLMQFGLWGVLSWGMMFWFMYKYSAYGNNNRTYPKAFMFSALTLCVFTDTIYHFFIFLGAVLLGKIRQFEINK